MAAAFLLIYGLCFSLPERDVLERLLEQMPPDAHGLTMLPFFGGERSPGYHGDARAAMNGWSLSTSAIDIWRAALEAVAFRFAAIYDLLRTAISPPPRNYCQRRRTAALAGVGANSCGCAECARYRVRRGRSICSGAALVALAVWE